MCFFRSGRNLNRLRAGGLTPFPQMIQDVHEVDIGVVGGVVGIEVLVNVTIGKVFCAHIVEMVGGLHTPPIPENLRVLGRVNLFFYAVEFVNGVGLHGITEPSGEVTLRVGPTDQMRDIDRIHGGIVLDYLAGRHEVVVRVTQHLFREVSEKLEDARVLPLMLAEGFVIHEEINHVAGAIGIVNPVGEFLCGERPFRPVTVGEAKGNIIAERIILQQEFEALTSLRLIHEVGAAISQDRVGSFRQDGVKPAHGFDGVSQIVVVDELRISKHTRSRTEEFLDQVRMLIDLLNELLLGVERAEAMVIRFPQEFDLPGLGQRIKRTEYLRAISLKLLQHGAGYAVRDLEPVGVLANDFQEKSVGGQVALVGHFSADGGVLVLIEVVLPLIENGVMA